jgi:beta-carotene ketolase (CrtW type)
MARARLARSDHARALERQGSVGLSLAVAIIAAWLALHLWSVLWLDLTATPLLLAFAVIALKTWLSVGLFIVAHDAMHGSLAPRHRGVAALAGRVALLLFAGLRYETLRGKHMEHHRHAGTAQDPDFDPDHPRSFWPWFLCFTREHVGWRELGAQSLIAAAHLVVLGASFSNLMLFWAAPALLATVQLFYFGTYRPHRHGDAPFADQHRTRSERFPRWLAVLTCFNFGYHHEHHDRPHLPWWRLRSDGDDRQGRAHAD